MDKQVTLDRLEQDGQYVDANICVNAYVELCGCEPPTWRKVVEKLWILTDGEFSENSA